MNAEQLLQLTEFELRSAGDSVDLQDVAFQLAKRMAALSIPQIEFEQADTLKLQMRDARERYARGKFLS